MRRRRFPDPCWVYFAQVEGGGPIKVGASRDASHRIETLQAWCPFELVLICEVSATYFAEAVLHDLLKAFCIRGEWYEPNALLTEVTDHIRESGDFPDRIAREIEMRWRNRLDVEATQNMRRFDRQRLAMPFNAAMFRDVSDEVRKARGVSIRNRRAEIRAAKGSRRSIEFQITAKSKSVD